MKKYYLYIILLLLLFLNSCFNIKLRNKTTTQTTRTLVHSDQTLSFDDIIADTIIYSVKIYNAHPEDEWESWKLRNMNRFEFINEVFNRVYSGEIKAYDYFNDVLLTIDNIKKIEQEADYSRAKIEELQFEEIWFFSGDKKHFHKEVLSIVLAYGVYNEYGVHLGLKPVFKVKLNKE